MHNLVRPFLLAGVLTVGATAAVAGYSYENVFDGAPIDVPQQDLPSPVETFHETGENPFVNDSEAVARGKEIYSQSCQACHKPDGSGRIGPNFLDDKWHYEETATMRGRFAIVYDGGAGAMQAFKNRLSQKEILEVLAYIEHLRAQAGQ